MRQNASHLAPATIWRAPRDPLPRSHAHCKLRAQIVFRVWVTFREQKWSTFRERRSGVDAEMLSKIIRAKNRLVPTYRRKVDRLWLLIASSFWESASNFYV